MIPVKAPRKPRDFNAKVRNPGLQYLKDQGIAETDRIPSHVKTSKIPDYWTTVSDKLWMRCGNVCSYLCIYIDPIGGRSVDHFVHKRAWAGGCYEWSNYRPACLALNRNKGTKEVLDPFKLLPETFHLNLLSGMISINPGVCRDVAKARETLVVLKLNSKVFAELRQKHWIRYLRNKDSITLRELSPFVWYEAKRQGLL